MLVFALLLLGRLKRDRGPGSGVVMRLSPVEHCATDQIRQRM